MTGAPGLPHRAPKTIFLKCGPTMMRFIFMNAPALRSAGGGPPIIAATTASFATRLRCGGDHWKAQPTDRSLRIYIQSGSKPSGERKNPIFAATLLGKTRNSLMSDQARSEEHTSELQSLMRISYAVFCLKKKN